MMHSMLPTPNPTNGQTGACEKHYIPATSFAGGKNTEINFFIVTIYFVTCVIGALLKMLRR